MPRTMFAPTLAAAFTAAILVSGAARADSMAFHATLNGASEVPANTTKGTGTATAMLDTTTHKLSYTVTYSGMTGPVVAAHIHGPAAPGKNAGVIVPLQKPLTSPIKGEATLTQEQITALEAGKYYINLHTAAHKGGEIRGQLTH